MFRSFSSLLIGAILQVIFFVLFFASILSKMNHVVGFFTCLSIGIGSFMAGIHSVKHGHTQSVVLTILSIGIILLAIFIVGFTFFAYLSVEGDGRGPLLFQ